MIQDYCQNCRLLEQAHELATQTYLVTLNQQLRLFNHGCAQAAKDLDSLAQMASLQRDNARQALMEHQGAHCELIQDSALRERAAPISSTKAAGRLST